MEIIGKILIDNLVMFGLGAVIITPIAVYLGKQAFNLIQGYKRDLYKQIELINNPDIRKLVEDIILGIEQSIGSEAGQIKFAKAKAEILAKVPDILDPIVDKLLQAVYDSLKMNGKIN
jgi:hypothetical protein